MMIKYLIWDFNGTILDDLDLSIELLNKILKKQNKPTVNKKRYLDIFGFPLKEYYFKAGISYEKATFETIAHNFIVEYQPQSLKLSLHKGVKTTLKKLKDRGIKNICLSASEENNLLEQLTHYQIIDYFDEVIGTNNVYAVGKDQLGLEYFKEKKINPLEVLYLGDTTYDYEVGLKLGVKVVLFSKGHHSKKRLMATRVPLIDKISDIIKIIEGENKNEKVF
jgi:phosphoglycolate phosphatase